MDLVDKAFVLWERTNQPRRARARLNNDYAPLLCVLPPENLKASGQSLTQHSER